MKKTFIGLFAIAMIAGTIVSCKKDKKEDCASAVKKYQEAFSAYQANPTANCASFKTAIQEYIKSECFSSLPAEQKALIEELGSSDPCPR